jgi:hypothetical protein
MRRAFTSLILLFSKRVLFLTEHKHIFAAGDILSASVYWKEKEYNAFDKYNSTVFNLKKK